MIFSPASSAISDSSSTPCIQTISPCHSTTGQDCRSGRGDVHRSNTSLMRLGPRECRNRTRSPARGVRIRRKQSRKAGGKWHETAIQTAPPLPLLELQVCTRRNPKLFRHKLTDAAHAQNAPPLLRWACQNGWVPPLSRIHTWRAEFLCARIQLLLPSFPMAARSTRRRLAGCRERRRSISMESEVSPGSVLLDRPPPRTGLPGSKIIGRRSANSACQYASSSRAVAERFARFSRRRGLYSRQCWK